MFPKGFKGEPYRATDGTVFVCVEGQGSTKVDGEVLDWGPNDVFVVPPWKRYAHNVAKEISAVLDLRPPGAESARHLARGRVTTAGRVRTQGRAFLKPHANESWRQRAATILSRRWG